MILLKTNSLLPMKNCVYIQCKKAFNSTESSITYILTFPKFPNLLLDVICFIDQEKGLLEEASPCWS